MHRPGMAQQANIIPLTILLFLGILLLANSPGVFGVSSGAADVFHRIPTDVPAQAAVKCTGSTPSDQTAMCGALCATLSTPYRKPCCVRSDSSGDSNCVCCTQPTSDCPSPACLASNPTCVQFVSAGVLCSATSRVQYNL